MKTQFDRQSGIQDGIDFDAHYTVSGWGRGIAWYLLGWAVRFEPVMCYTTDDDGNEIEVESGEFDPVPDTDTVVAVMVGDNRRFEIAREDLNILPEDGFCRSCGQVGCGCNVYV